MAPELVIFDLDGVVYRGTDPVPGAVDLVAALRRAGVLVRFATNNSMVDRTTYVARLEAMGIPAARDEIVTSTSATVEHLARHAPSVRRVLVVGEQGIIDELTAAGLETVSAADAVPDPYDGEPLAERYDAVVAGLDRSFDFRRLAAAGTAIRAGARLIATNADLRYPTPVGFLPGAGTIVAAIAAAGGVPAEVIGKPQPAMFLATLEAAGVDASAAVVVGDNPDADVVAAHRAGVASILVLTGVADRATASVLDGERLPTAVAADPEAVGALLGMGPPP